MTSDNRIITLITDFGTKDGYVGAMKGMLLSINPRATIVDITHQIEPQNILQAAYVLKITWQYYPEGTIHLIVVDPGVGTDRKAVILETPIALFVAPDNGSLNYVIKDMTQAVTITNPRYWADSVSSTFHGRDIFAPVAAHLSLNVPITEFGERITSLVQLPGSHPIFKKDGCIIGHVIHIDRFGNLITNVKRSDLPADATFKIKEHSIQQLSSTYAKSDGLLALIGSDDHLEVSLRNGNAAKHLGANCGETVEITRPEHEPT